MWKLLKEGKGDYGEPARRTTRVHGKASRSASKVNHWKWNPMFLNGAVAEFLEQTKHSKARIWLESMVTCSGQGAAADPRHTGSIHYAACMSTWRVSETRLKKKKGQKESILVSVIYVCYVSLETHHRQKEANRGLHVDWIMKQIITLWRLTQRSGSKRNPIKHISHLYYRNSGPFLDQPITFEILTRIKENKQNRQNRKA